MLESAPALLGSIGRLLSTDLRRSGVNGANRGRFHPIECGKIKVQLHDSGARWTEPLGTAMDHYRLYCLDDKLHIIAQREFNATGDAEAIAAVQCDHPEADREIWEERRKVALVRASERPKDGHSCETGVD